MIKSNSDLILKIILGVVLQTISGLEKSISSQDWITWSLKNAAHASVLLGHVALNSEVALLAPSAVPRVLDEPVVSALIGTIANEEHGVVDGIAAESLDNSVLVELESSSTGVDADGDWAECEGLSQLDWVKSLDIFEACQFNVSSLSLGCALLVLGHVWILTLSLDWDVGGVVVGVLDKSTTASIVSVVNGAINDLLL